MAKGRRFNPPLDQDGRWFPHIGLPQKTPESITRATLKEPRSPRASRQAEEKLPPIYKIREKQAVHHSFPFSVHDNRHSFANSGFYLDSQEAPVPSVTRTDVHMTAELLCTQKPDLQDLRPDSEKSRPVIFYNA
ncbi:testis expressed 36 [Phyllostomus discolor]|uniref:Testis expressed 36 n=1 Tax=Phyllostomus discolor TaxID=89673 RepID=A0A834AIV4_9CHIR|nr:testis expressed 36 [Phyllostomus discolor]